MQCDSVQVDDLQLVFEIFPRHNPNVLEKFSHLFFEFKKCAVKHMSYEISKRAHYHYDMNKIFGIEIGRSSFVQQAIDDVEAERKNEPIIRFSIFDDGHSPIGLLSTSVSGVFNWAKENLPTWKNDGDYFYRKNYYAVRSDLATHSKSFGRLWHAEAIATKTLDGEYIYGINGDDLEDGSPTLYDRAWKLAEYDMKQNNIHVSEIDVMINFYCMQVKDISLKELL